jgi:hypothetical protein
MGRSYSPRGSWALYNMVLVEALSEILVEKGIVGKSEVLERVEKIKKEASMVKHRPR